MLYTTAGFSEMMLQHLTPETFIKTCLIDFQEDILALI